MRSHELALAISLLGSCQPRSGAPPAPVSPPAAATLAPAAEPSAAAPAPVPVDPGYVPRPVFSGAPAALPPVPTLPARRLMAGAGVYTVWGAGYSLRHPALTKKIRGAEVRIRGVIGQTNLPEAPRCAVHAAGIADPEGCVAPVPTFWLCDKASSPAAECIQVMGWASNFAQLYSAMQDYAGRPDAERQDDYWGILIPNPIPAPGAEVTVTGRFDVTFTGASSGTAADPVMGILTYKSMLTEKPSASPARLPGMP